jgi:hypothetical protein
MANRHHVKKAEGGRIAYTGKGSNVVKEEKNKEDSFSRGGAKKRKHGGKVEGEMAKPRLDKRARGGRIGADKSPFSSAATAGKDTGRTPKTKDTLTPRAHGGRVMESKGGNAGSGHGHSEPHETHKPEKHYKGGGAVAGKATGGAVAAKAGGGKCEEPEKEKEEEDEGEDDRTYSHGGKARHHGMHKDHRGMHPRADGGGNWIAGATENKGALHKKLGVPAGQKIPAKKMAKAAHSSNPTERKEASLAKTLKGMH